VNLAFKGLNALRRSGGAFRKGLSSLADERLLLNTANKLPAYMDDSYVQASVVANQQPKLRDIREPVQRARAVLDQEQKVRNAIADGIRNQRRDYLNTADVWERAGYWSGRSAAKTGDVAGSALSNPITSTALFVGIPSVHYSLNSTRPEEDTMYYNQVPPSYPGY